MDAGTVCRALRTDDGRRNPYPYYAALHRLGVACPLDGADDQYDVVVHGYDAVSQVLRDPVFRVVDAARLDRSRTDWRDHPTLSVLLDSMFFTNEADHARVRRVFSRVFTPRRVAALEPAIVRLVDELLDGLAERGADGSTVDFMAEVAFPLPSNVVGELLGVPEQDRAWFRPLVRAFGAVLELGGVTPAAMAAADDAATQLTDYFAALVAHRRAAPRDDLVSSLVTVTGDDRLGDRELVANLITLFNAGFVTTTHLLGNGLALLLERPELLASLRGQPESAPRYVEEVLRYEPPVHLGIRWAAADAEIAGLPVPAGGTALVLLGAGNRDPRRFADPDVFDPDRPDNQPLSFGAGPHYCLGAALSRMEGQLAFPMLLRRFPGLAAAGPLGQPNHLVLRGYDALPVVLG